MERVIVTVKKYKETRVRDLDIPAGLEAGELAEIIAKALHWDQDPAGGAVKYHIEAEPPGRVLGENETLEKAGVCDGAWLTFLPEDIYQARLQGAPEKKPAPPPVVQTSSTPVTSWRSLGIDLGGDDGEASDEKPPDTQSSDGFVWKEVDLD